MVSIHAPVKVRQARGNKMIIDYGFNPRTREGATNGVLQHNLDEMVSIHAPVKVRLADDYFTSRGVSVSIHAPVKVRHTVRVFAYNEFLFQSTHP